MAPLDRNGFRLLLAAVTVGLAVGCTEPNPGYQPDPLARPDLSSTEGFAIPDRGGPELARLDREPKPPGKPIGVDLLIVVDNSPGMASPQKWLARDIAALTGAAGLETLPGGASFRIGVTSTDVGVGAFANQNCSANGDKGKLLVRSGCTGPSGGVKYLERIGSSINYTPPLADRLSCMVQLGEQGCGFEQPLEAMHLALSSANPGFLRPEAALAVIILSNEDDCSAVSSSLFDSKDASLGPYSSYRCFRYGALCNGTQPPQAPTLLQGCRPGQSYLHPVKARYIDFLVGLKPPGWVSVVVFAALPESVTEVVQVGSASPYWYLEPACQNNSVKGDPAFRLLQLVDEIDGGAAFSSICGDSYTPALKGLVSQIKAAF